MINPNLKEPEQFPEISTGRLLLRKIKGSDIEYIFKGLSHPGIIKYYGVSFHSLEATKEQMKWYADLERDGTGIWWAICSKDKQTFYGAAGLNNIQKEHAKGEIGFWLMPEFWGHGFIREAIPFILNYGFKKLGVHRIEGYVEHGNQNSKKSLQKSGFTFEGTMKDCEIKNGKFISLDIYAMIDK